MRVAVLIVSCLALASPAAAQSTNTPLSILDAAIFSHPPSDSVHLQMIEPKTIVLDNHLLGTLSSYHQDYSSRELNLHDIRRYGFNFSTPVSGIPVLRSIPKLNETAFEVHGSRDFGIDKRHHQMYGLGFERSLGDNASLALEGNRYKGSPINLRGLPGERGAWVGELTLRFTR